MAREKKDPHPLIFELLSSLLFGLTIVIATGVGLTTSPVLQGYASVWIPILYAGAMLSVITMFAVSFINLINQKYVLHRYILYEIMVASFTLLALTAGDVPGTVLTILALLLGIIGMVQNNKE